MKFFTRRRAAVLATAVALAAGSLATAPVASADAGPWPGTEGKILFDGPQLYDPATGAVTQVPNTYDGDWSSWAPDGSRLVSAWQDVQSIRPNGASKVTLPDGEGFHASYIPSDLTYGWGGRYIFFTSNGQLGYGPSDGSWAPRPLLTSAQEPTTVCDNDPTVSTSGVIAFERRVNYGCYDNKGIWTYDPETGTVKQILTEGEQPAFSPDGTQLAFVRYPDGDRRRSSRRTPTARTPSRSPPARAATATRPGHPPASASSSTRTPRATAPTCTPRSTWTWAAGN